MNGAEALIESLSAGGVDVCFANPGTSEMHLVAAIDKHPKMRAILGLFEGVVTGAADGYGRMADKPAVTLLHLGPGLENGGANLHNAKRARSPVINIVGDHATDHLKYDAPLTSDLAGIARPLSDWFATSTSSLNLAELGAEALENAHVYPGQVATVIAPANHAWEEGAEVVQKPLRPNVRVSEDAINAAVNAIVSSKRGALFLGGRSLRDEALLQAGRIAAAGGIRLICETFPARLQRGVGRVPVERLPYFGEAAAEFLKDLDYIILVGAPAPVAFFAYPDKPSWLSPPDAQIITLADPRDDAFDSLSRFSNALNLGYSSAVRQEQVEVNVPSGELTPHAIGAVLAQLMPEQAIVSDEATTCGLPIYEMLKGAPAHDWLTLTGGSIGQGLPVAVGAAVACPARKVIALQADGSAMYTLQSLWTMARENLNVTIILLNNGGYAILKHELHRVGVTDTGAKAHSLLDLTKPALDWVALAQGMGVQATRANTIPDFRKALTAALSHPGPRLVEASMIR